MFERRTEIDDRVFTVIQPQQHMSSDSQDETIESEQQSFQGLNEIAAFEFQNLQNQLGEDTPSAEAESERALDRLSEIGNLLCQMQVADLNELRVKAKIYGMLAPEASTEFGEAPIEERLLGSILQDIEKLAG